MTRPMLALISLLFAVSCSIDLRQVPAPRSGSSPLSSDPRTLYLGSFDVYAGERSYVADAWRSTMVSIIKSHRIFENVQVMPKTKDVIQPDYVIMDLEVRPRIEESYNWWVTWPALYPLSGYWPVQIRTAKYTVEVTYRIIDKKRKVLATDTVKKEDEATVYFYGFFRTGTFEKLIEVTNLEVMEACAKKIESAILD